MASQNYTCRTVRHMLPLHVGGDLDPRHIKAVDGHLKSCLSCFREFRDFASMRSRMGVLAEERLPEAALDGFVEEVMARIAVGEPGPAAAAPGQPVLRWPVLPRLAAAAAVLILCAAGWRYMSDGAIRPLDRPATAARLAPANVVESMPTAATHALPLPDNGMQRPFDRAPLSVMPAGMQGLSVTPATLSLMQRAPGVGRMVVFIQGEQPAVADDSADGEPADDKAALLKERQR